MTFGLMNIAFNFDQLTKALHLAYSGEKPTEVQEKAAEQTENEKNIIKARDFMRYKEACESDRLASRRKSVNRADDLAARDHALSQTPSRTPTEADGRGELLLHPFSNTHPLLSAKCKAFASAMLHLRSASNIAYAADVR